MYDKTAVFILVGRDGGEDYIPSRNVESKTTIKIIGRHIKEGSTIHTDSFKSYLGLSEAGYNHEYVNHSEGECHINRASILRPWLSIHRGICKNNLTLYLTAFKTYRRLRKMKPLQAIKETIKIIYI